MGKTKSDRATIIEWYREDILDYQKKIAKYNRLIRTIRERIEALEKKEEENDIKRRLPKEG